MWIGSFFCLAALINFADLSDFQNQEVEIRGFVYLSEKKEWILAEEPNLKSCCVGSESKANKQVMLPGVKDELPKYQVLQFKGHLLNKEGRFILLNSQRIEKTNYEIYLLAAFFILLSLGVWKILLRK